MDIICQHCGKSFESKETGRRPKVYCSNSCRTIAWQKRNSKNVSIARDELKRMQDSIAAMTKELEELRASTKQLESETLESEINYSSEPVYDGHKARRSWIAMDEGATTETGSPKEFFETVVNPLSNEALIKRHEDEIKGLGAGSLGVKRKKFLEGEIKKLKKEV